MKTWIDLSKIEQPAQIAAMQKDERGYPIPHTVMWVDGKPDFRVIDPNKWYEAARSCQCGICGQMILDDFAFVGGPLSMKNRLFTDLPMHKECAEYALKVCPFIAAPKFGYLKQHGHPVREIEGVSDNRPDRFGLGMTSKYKLVQLPQGDIAIWADEFISVEWWQNGEKQ